MSIDATTPVGEAMSAPLVTVSRRATLREAAELMRERDISSLFVPGASAGIVTTTDVVAAVAADRDLSAVTVGEVMTADVERVTTAQELGEAAAMMTALGIKHLPVIDDDGDYVGMLSTTDLASVLG